MDVIRPFCNPFFRTDVRVQYAYMDLHKDLADLLAVPSFYKDANCKGSNQDDFFPGARKFNGYCKKDL